MLASFARYEQPIATSPQERASGAQLGLGLAQRCRRECDAAT
jgi:hypothetical protein